MHIKLLFASALMACCLLACSGSRSYAKRGAQLETSGLYAEAADMYLQSAQRDPRNVEAKIGLKKNGQLLLNDKLGVFFKAFATGGKEEAVNAFLAAEAYSDRVRQAGVMLDIPEHYRSDFTSVRTAYLDETYAAAQARLAGQDHRGAEEMFARIVKLDPQYKDAARLKDVAYMEPIYLKGKQAFEQGLYRKAYADLATVLATDPTYKDAQALQEESLVKGRYAIAVLPFGTTGATKAQAAALQAHTIAALTTSNDPFLRVVDRENTERILEEQRMGLSGIVDEGTAVSAGKLLGAQAVLLGTVISYREEPGKLLRTDRDGYEAYQVERVNKETQEKTVETRYNPVKYAELDQVNKVVISVSYRLVSLETGEVIMSQVVDRNATDRMQYATYDGKANALYPMLNGAVNTNTSARRELSSKLNGARTIRSTAELGSDLVRSVCTGIATSVQQEISTRIP